MVSSIRPPHSLSALATYTSASLARRDSAWKTKIEAVGFYAEMDCILTFFERRRDKKKFKVAGCHKATGKQTQGVIEGCDGGC